MATGLEVHVTVDHPEPPKVKRWVLTVMDDPVGKHIYTRHFKTREGAEKAIRELHRDLADLRVPVKRAKIERIIMDVRY